MKTIAKTNIRNALCGLTTGLLLLAAGILTTPANAEIYVGSWRSGVAKYNTATGAPINVNFIGTALLGTRVDPYALMLWDNILFVGDDYGRRIGTYNATTGASINTNFITSTRLQGARGLARVGNTLYIAAGSTVRTFSATTGATINLGFITGLSGATAIAISGNTLYVAMQSSNSVSTYDATTGAPINLSFITGLNLPQGIAVFGNNVYVSNWWGNNVGKYDATTGTTINANFITGLSGPIPLVIFNNVLYVVNYRSRILGKYDATTGAAINASFITGLKSGADGLAISPDSNNSPTVSLPGPATIGCTSVAGASASVMVTVGDGDNDPLTVTWSVNNIVVATNSLSAGATSDTLVNHPFGFGVNTVSVSVSDGTAPAVTGSTTVTVTAHDAPVPQVATLPILTGECAVSITVAPLANDPCAAGGVVAGTTSLGTLPLNFTAQGTYTVTWTYTSPHDGMLSTTQDQTVIVKDITPPTITCPPDVSVAFGSVPAAATDPAGFLAQGGTITDNCDPNGSVTSFDLEEGYCPTIITRLYIVTDAAGNESTCEQTITVNNLFAEDGILWLQPLARKGMSSDTDPSDGGTLKYRFKLGSTIPIKVQAQGCDGNVSSNANVIGKIVVFGDTDMDGVIDANEAAMLIDFNGVGEAGGVMDKVDGKLQFNLDTKKLVQTFKCYILQVTVTDSSTGESRTEIVPLQAK